MEEHKKQLQLLKQQDASDGSDSNATHDSDSGEDEEWEGFAEPPAVDYEAEYIDEDRYTTVTVEEMDPSREGLLRSAKADDSEEKEEEGNEQDPATEAEAKRTAAAKKPRKRPTTDNTKKKKKFRYESKEDRKLALAKQRLSKAKKAKARRER